MGDVSLTNEQYLKIIDKLDSVNQELLKVKRTNSKLKGENRHLRRVIKKLRDDMAARGVVVG